jgi:Trk K+ transport system NAD-binding subunit
LLLTVEFLAICSPPIIAEISSKIKPAHLYFGIINVLKQDSILIIGSGHLAYRLRELCSAQGHNVRLLSRTDFDTDTEEISRSKVILKSLEGIDIRDQQMIFLVDSQDERNLELLLVLISLSKDVHITASLFNENIAPHIGAAHPNVTILNPAKIAAPTFVASLTTPITHSLRYSPSRLGRLSRGYKRDNLLYILGISFLALIVGAVTYFHVFDSLSWVNSLYFVVVTIATVGYGDINLLNSSTTSKLVAVLLILGSTFFVWMIFSLTIDRIIKKRVQLSLGRRKYSDNDHVVLCGLGKLGFFVANGLIEAGEKVLIIEKDEDSSVVEYFRNKGVHVYIGDARLPTVLEDTGILRAKALYSLINNDYINLEVGLNARSFNPDLRLILRIFDESMSRKVKENLDIHLTHSMTAIADENFYEVLKK